MGCQSTLRFEPNHAISHLLFMTSTKRAVRPHRTTGTDAGPALFPAGRMSCQFSDSTMRRPRRK